MSDTGLSSAAAGLDVAMPSSSFWGVDGGYLTQAVKNGSLAESRVTDMATRLVASWYQMGQDVGFPARGVGMPSIFYTPHPPVYARDPSSKQFLIDGALEGHVLVKNVNSALPLKKPKLLSVYGYDAPSPLEMNVGGPNDFIGETWVYGYESVLDYIPFISGTPPPQIAFNGTIISGGGSGANSPAYISAPFDAIKEQAYQDDTNLFWDFMNVHPTVDTNTDACLVFINAFATEADDRAGLHGECLFPFFQPSLTIFRRLLRCPY
jgi:beta-glucosidase